MNGDWNDLRFFLAVARARTLSRAATALDVDQTTVGRRITSLEARLGVQLFERAAGVFALTAAGKRICESAERMEEAASEVATRAIDDAGRASGTVRIATTDSLAEAFIVPAVRLLRAAHPHIDVIVQTGFPLVDLRKDEADLAVRIVRPTDPRLAAKRLAAYALRLYASRDYIAEHGTPRALAGHALLAYEDAVKTGRRYPFSDVPAAERVHALQSNNHRVLLASALAGLGIVQLPSYVGDAHPELVPVMPERDDPYDVWLVGSAATRRLAAVRAAADAITRAFRAPVPKPTRARAPRAPAA
ncbi:MAG TPA: LysR family transcriptional regulator [Kofleriaceae bacterium]|nr:LysR family transcriptional regulator [Kofleriaceae bacterium]